MKNLNKYQKMGWLAVSFSIVITSIWAFWGASETFHEGWYYDSLIKNIGLTLLQYLSPMLLFMGVGVISIRWPRIGAIIHLIAALAAAWFFNILTNTVIIFLLMPLVGIGLLYWYGSLPSRKKAIRWMVGLPLFIALVAGMAPGYRVSQRIKDRDLDAQLLVGNGIMLKWAPSGPGWPQAGESWHEANRVCQWLQEDGKTLAADAQNIWRLPTVDEAVRSMAIHGENSGGVWDAINAKATYENRPDKEYPLWDIYSPIIYWWTATEVDEKNAHIIVYDGKIWPRAKQLDMGYLGFRCVKE